MAEVVQTLDASHGDLLVQTGVGGHAAKMGHRLTIVMSSWQAAVSWTDERPTTAELTVEVDSFQVRTAEGGLTPLSSPEKGLIRSNALKTLDHRRHPVIGFRSTDISEIAGGYLLAGQLSIHGRTHPHTIDLRVDECAGMPRLSCTSTVRQTEYGIKPYSMLMGAMRVADEVTVSFTAKVGTPASSAH